MELAILTSVTAAMTCASAAPLTKSTTLTSNHR